MNKPRMVHCSCAATILMLAKSAGACFHGDVQIGRIGICASLPVDANQWAWPCGFHPFSNRGQLGHGAASDLFKSARRLRGLPGAGFAKVTEVDVQDYRQERDRCDLETCHLETGRRMPAQFSDEFASLLRR
jgi:hypothetical protein